MSYFKSNEEMLREAEVLIREDGPASEDKAVLTNFYNGGDLCEKDSGFSGNVKNHLMGFDAMNDAALHLEGIFTRQKLVWRVSLPNAKPQDRQRWEMAVEDKLNAIIKKCGRFKPQWKGLCGAVTLFGRGVLVHTDKYDWCPELMDPLVPRRTGIMADDVPYSVIPGQLTIRDLQRYKLAAEKNPDTSWKMDAINAVLETLGANVGTEMSGGSNAYASNITIAESADLNRLGVGAELRTTILVFYVYEHCTDDNGSKYVKLTILARHGEDVRAKYQKENGNKMPMALYKDDYFADEPDEWLHPYFIDCKLGRTTTWHNTMGLGRLNYGNDVEIEVFMNEGIAGAKEQMRRLYKVAQDGDMEAMQQFLSGDRAGNIIPTGLEAAEVQKSAGFKDGMQMMGVLQGSNARHSKSSVPNAGEGGGQEELEVQAIERQGRNAQSLASRIEDFLGETDRLGAEILRRFLTIEPMPGDRACNEITEFQDFLKAQKIPISILREKGKDGKLKNVGVNVNRSIGTGDRVAQVMVNRMMLARINLYSPQAQQEILRRVTADETGDYAFAEALVPNRPKVDPRQIERANTENQACVMRGITGYVPEIQDDDMPMYHIQEHMGGLEGLLAKGQAQGWEPIDAGAFKALGTHTAAHIQQIMADKAQKNTATQLMARLQQFAQQADSLMKDMQQKQADQELTASEKVRFAQADRKIGLAEQKEQNIVSDRRDKLMLKEAELTAKGVEAGAQLALKDRQIANDEFKVDANNALKLNEYASSPIQAPSTTGNGTV